MDTVKIEKPIPFWRSRNTLSISLMAAGFTAVFKAMDNITVHNLITSQDGLTAAFAYLLIGSWTGTIFGIAFALLCGKQFVDKDFVSIVFRNKRMHASAAVSGFIGSASTLFLLWGNQMGDPSVTIALGNLTVIYTVLWELHRKRLTFREMWLPTALTVTGGILAVFGGSYATSLFAILFIVVISNSLGAMGEIIDQNGARAADGVNFFIWRFAWLAITGTLLAICVSLVRGTFDQLESTISNGLTYLPWVVLTMFFVFLGIGLKLTAKRQGAVSVVLIVLSAQILLGYVLTFVGNLAAPGLFGDLPSDPVVWLVRIVGGGLIIWGIFRLRKN